MGGVAKRGKQEKDDILLEQRCFHYFGYLPSFSQSLLGLSIIKFVFSGNVKINKNWLIWLSYSYEEVMQIFFYILESIAEIKLSFGAQQFRGKPILKNMFPDFNVVWSVATWHFTDMLWVCSRLNVSS